MTVNGLSNFIAVTLIGIFRYMLMFVKLVETWQSSLPSKLTGEI